MKATINFKALFRSCGLAVVSGLLCVSAVAADTIDFFLDREAPGTLRFRWAHGSISPKHNVDPRIHVQRYNAHTFVMRQNKAINAEAPFMYLLFGNDRALLVDSGATANAEYFPIREKVNALIQRWLDENGKDSIELIVAQTATDAHHIQGHGQFEGREDTVFLGLDLLSIKEFIGIESWPDSIGSINLGGRIVQVIPSPGVSLEGFSFYDPYTRWMLSGPVIKPGRLWVTRWPAYRETVHRLSDFAQENPVYWVMGNAIEMSYHAGIDYRKGAVYQPSETLLQMEPDVIGRVVEAVEAMNGFTGIEIYDDFILMYGVPRGARAYGFPNPIPDRFQGPPIGGLR